MVSKRVAACGIRPSDAIEAAAAAAEPLEKEGVLSKARQPDAEFVKSTVAACDFAIARRP